METSEEELTFFEQTGVRKEEYWQFIQLIAPHRDLPAGQSEWRSKDAIGMYCFKCKKRLKFTAGESVHVRNHMKTVHPDDLDNFLANKKSKKRTIRESDDDMDLVEDSGLTLFPQISVRKEEYWQFIKLIAPSTFPPPGQKGWKSKDAIGMYCLKCKKRLKFARGESVHVRHHMQTKHQKDIDKFLVKKKLKKGGNSNNSLLASTGNSTLGGTLAPCTSTTSTTASTLNHDVSFHGNASTNSINSMNHHHVHHVHPVFDARNLKEFSGEGMNLLLKWISNSLTPLSVLVDEDFKKFLQFLNPSYEVPFPDMVASHMTNMRVSMENSLHHLVAKEVQYCSLSSDVWEAKGYHYFSLTIHYLTDQFQMRNFTLDVTNLSSSYTEIQVANHIKEFLTHWNLKPSQITHYIRNSENEILNKATKDFEFSSIGCLSHLMELMLSVFLLPRSSSSSWNDAHPVEMYLADKSLSIKERKCIATISSLVGRFRNLSMYICNNPLVRMKLEQMKDNVVIKLPFDLSSEVSLKWNNLLDMLRKMVEIRSLLTSFLATLDSEQQQFTDFPGEFRDILAVESWAIMEGLLVLLMPFENALFIFSSEHYPTLPLVIPTLRLVKEDLENFNLISTSEELMEKYPQNTFPKEAFELLLTCQKMILRFFSDQFSSLTNEHLWISSLDPRCSKLEHVSQDEKSLCREYLIHYAMEECNNEKKILCTTAKYRQNPYTDRLFGAKFHSMEKQTHDEGSPNFRNEVVQQVDLYFQTLGNVHVEDPLLWWSENADTFPYLKGLARKWLGCVTTCSPSHLVFTEQGQQIKNKKTLFANCFMKDIIFLHNNNAFEDVACV